jgi:hypothetical protein
MGYILGDCFTNSSGHPVSETCYLISQNNNYFCFFSDQVFTNLRVVHIKIKTMLLNGALGRHMLEYICLRTNIGIYFNDCVNVYIIINYNNIFFNFMYLV